jgi:hypothetical protein
MTNLMSIFELIRQKLHGDPPLLPVERRLAKRWVKERLKRMYPELRDDPEALEQAYRSLDMQARTGIGKGGATMFEILLPGRLDDDR